MDDPEITEIMVNGPEEIFIESKGRIRRWEKRFESKEQLLDLIQQIVSSVNRIVNTSSPIADARLADGSRVHVVLEPVALDGPILTIRKFPEPVTMERLLRYGSISEEAAVFLQKLWRPAITFLSAEERGGKNNIFKRAVGIYSFWGAGDYDRGFRRAAAAPYRKPGAAGNPGGQRGRSGSDRDRMLIRAALRMRPDRILIGEVRGKEALDLLQAMNTGHDGSFSTGHANSPRDMLARLETMVLMAAELPLPAIRSQIASAVDIMVHVAKLRDKSRKVTAIEEVDRYENGEIILNSLYRFQEHEKGGEKNGASRRVEGSLEKTGELRHREKLRMAGIEL